jgi:hypothetical protein
MEHIVESGREGASRLDERSADTAYLNRFGYELNERALAALAEFFRMAYYHGVLKDIPDVKLHDLEGQASSRVRHN